MKRWVVVVAPRGDVVRLTDRYSCETSLRALVACIVEGHFDDGTFVYINGSQIALAWLEPVECGPQHPGQITVDDALEAA